MIIPLNSHEITYSTKDYIYLFEKFKIVGLNYGCVNYYDPEHCIVFKKSFESRLVSLERFVGSVEVRIDITPLLNNDSLTHSRDVKIVDSILSNRQVIIDGNLYKKR